MTIPTHTLKLKLISRCWVAELDPNDFPSTATLYQRGLAYLYQMRSLALDPDVIDFVHTPALRKPVCIWIGSHIDAINPQLQGLLQVCQNCFHPWQRPPVQIFAAPFASQFGVDGVCNLQTQPISILIDVGRLLPHDWLALVIHEYAHAHLGVSGHHSDFVQILSHLCLALDFPFPDNPPAHDPYWSSFPPYRSNPHPDRFWSGTRSSLCTPPL